MWPFKKKVKRDLAKELDALSEDQQERLALLYSDSVKLVRQLREECLFRIDNLQMHHLELKKFLGIKKYEKTQEDPVLFIDGGLLPDMLTRLKECFYLAKRNK